MGEMLSVKNINVYYGLDPRHQRVSFHVNEGEIVTPDRCERRGQDHDDARDLRSAEAAERRDHYCGQTISKMERTRSSAWAWRRCQRAAACSAA